MKCKIIRDLLPLYHDDVASEESRGLVEEHLKTCAGCRKVLEEIQENVRTNNATGMEQPMANSFRVLKKRMRRKTVSKIAISVICAVAVVSALTYGVFFYETPVSYSEVTRTITQPIHSALDVITNVWGHNSIAALRKGDALYICCSDTFWTRYIARQNTYLSLEIPIAAVAPSAPAAPGTSSDSITGIPSAPEPPAPPNPLEGITKVFYLEGNIGKFSRDDAAFSKAAANAILLWEKNT